MGEVSASAVGLRPPGSPGFTEAEAEAEAQEASAIDGRFFGVFPSFIGLSSVSVPDIFDGDRSSSLRSAWNGNYTKIGGETNTR